MALLPPRLTGPLTPLVSSVHVDYLLPGGTAELHVNGVPTGRTATASTNGVDIPLSGFMLPANGSVTATWSLNGDQSPASLPELVLPIPNALPKPVILSPVHTAVDWIAVGGLYPGASVEIHGNAGLVGGPTPSNGPTVNVRIDQSISAGKRSGSRSASSRPTAERSSATRPRACRSNLASPARRPPRFRW